ncbi:glycoside hydrolase family 99-like domain-containing protein [Pseudomonadota bacterium]
MKSNVPLIAFYLPQFYPFRENNEWWGKGFTEWTNVTKARPLFSGHNQPHLPTDFGFYDLRVRETRRDQIEVAKKHGIYGFCYHYYWFSGKRLLDRPLDEMLADPDSDMPFCLCWANENWTRRWDAAEHHILIAQEYQKEDSLNFIKSLIPYFSDNRYIRYEGKPFLIVYRPQQIPDPNEAVGVWREYCREVGIGEIHICAALTHGNMSYKQFGFDSGVEFPPHNLVNHDKADKLSFFDDFQGFVVDYSEVAGLYLERKYEDDKVFKTVIPDWDNTPRTGNRAVIVLGASPAAYESWLSQTIKSVATRSDSSEDFVFINAWNEWAEGCHLEPDRKFGKAYLEATARAASGEGISKKMSSHEIDWAEYAPGGSLFQDLGRVLSRHLAKFRKAVFNRLKSIEPLRRTVRKIRTR